MSESCPLLIFQATPFCFGPASIALAIAREVRCQAVGPLRLVALGEGTAGELFGSCELFDEVHKFAPGLLRDKASPFWGLLRQAAAVVSVVDFDFVEATQAARLKTVFIDPLFWMWDKLPIRIDACAHYLALDFPGVREQAQRHAAEHPDDRIPEVVPAVRDNAAMATWKDTPRGDTLLVNFGGMASPLGQNLDLAIAMTRCLIEAASETGDANRVLVCASSGPLAAIRKAVSPLGEGITFASLPQLDFFRRLAECQRFATIPGLSVVFEALYFATPTLLLLPLNYSQHRQSEVYQGAFPQLSQIRWESVGDYQSLPAGLPEQDGVCLSFELGRRFRLDEAAQVRFTRQAAAFLSTEEMGPAQSESWLFDGAGLVAARVLEAARAASAALC